jgi:hypothetical protein
MDSFTGKVVDFDDVDEGDDDEPYCAQYYILKEEIEEENERLAHQDAQVEEEMVVDEKLIGKTNRRTKKCKK